MTDGPWRGRIADAETGEPIEGVVVLAVFYKLSPGVVHKERAYYAASEAVTDGEGRFVIPALPRESGLPPSSVVLEAPYFYYFKLGYRVSRFKGQGTPAFQRLHPNVQGERSRTMREAFVTEEGAHIELIPAKTREEQLRALSYPATVPLDQAPLTRAAIDNARASLGLK